MTRRDFELIAKAIRQRANEARAYIDPRAAEIRYDEVMIIARVMANAVAGTNPRFDRARFMAACGFKGK